MNSETQSDYVRLVLRWVDSPDEEPYTFDVKIDLLTRRIEGKCVYFGLCGDLEKKSEWYPVALKADGIIDWGKVAEDHWEWRYWRTNLRYKEIRRGEYVTLWDEKEQEFTYKIWQIAVLGSRLLDQ